MHTFVRRLAVCSAVVAAAAVAPAAVASADVVVPFQVNPAPWGNPNGSFDSPAVRCAASISDNAGVVRIVDGGGVGCYLVSEVRWLNFSTGATGVAQMSDALAGSVREAVLQTGSGQVAVMATSASGTSVPGFATFSVP